MSQTIPALPVREMGRAVARYVERMGFTADYADESYAVLRRDEAVIHLWRADDTSWSDRAHLATRPVRSGAESFLAGTASCRIRLGSTAELEPLHAELAATGVLHHISTGGVSDTDFGAREFHTVDLDGNLVTFFAWVAVDRPSTGSGNDSPGSGNDDPGSRTDDPGSGNTPTGSGAGAG